jgi:hypothetical protein
MPVIHEDDQHSPFLKPTDPCQVEGCTLQKHIFPHHRLKQYTGVHGLSRWCAKHTIEKGFCLRCGTNEIAHKDTGMCRACERIIDYQASVVAPGLTAKDLTRQLLKESAERPATYRVNLDV